MPQTKTHLRNQLENHEFDGIIFSRIEELLPRLPRICRDRGDLFAELYAQALLAIDRFDPRRGAKFSTYLYHHLRQHSANLAERERTRAFGTRKCRRVELGDDNDEDDAPRAQLAAPSSAERLAAVQELIAALGDERELFDQLVLHGAHEVFASCWHLAKLEKLGFCRTSVEQLCKKVDRLFPRYVA